MYLSWSGGCTRTLPDLTGCLRDPELRMARQLTSLDIRPPCGSIDMDQVRELRTHDFECLPLVKKKFPTKSKAAVMSIVTSTSNATKPIHHLDANILNLIFVFASTPARRFVKCWTEEDYESDW
uniref:Uncharacterized protein n=3 Tax=Phytophthora fragariae TaxID=53985 RepID=A0A6A3DH34_9STRA|nr:hypothetical protein PF009_g28640 [Phytophthora fragariae]